MMDLLYYKFFRQQPLFPSKVFHYYLFDIQKIQHPLYMCDLQDYFQEALYPLHIHRRPRYQQHLCHKLPLALRIFLKPKEHQDNINYHQYSFHQPKNLLEYSVNIYDRIVCEVHFSY
jgi:hypothetical protein